VKSDGARKAPAPDCRGRRFAIVAASFYAEIAADLVEGARRALHDCNVDDASVTVFEVPGCFEIPLVCRKLIEKRRFDAVVALGTVIRGETPHFEYVAGQCARGIMDVQLATGTPIGFGILTTETADQARERAARTGGDKGYAAAMAAAKVLLLDAGNARAGFRRN
jgi:6,7-dimethyl-8-ribityllumazine synthase